MASIGNITAAAAAARADTTLALANFNFEISLFTKRVDPPVEYEGVGQHLAKARLQEAQDGSQHTTARKLGLLFKGILPTTPNLIKAYGSRASEIAKSAKANPKGDVSSYGPFTNRVGADATTLWAAATSGHAAIQCHLLACMLARMWDAPEATSLWDEIILRRKMEVAADLEAEGEIDTNLMLATAQQFPRCDLADWDASCRSWLRVADSEKLVQQKKLRLIIDNIDLSVNNKPDTYVSVITAWTTAMKEMEKLLEGIPRSVQGGEILLGLMAWHLYPDLHCLSASNPRVDLKDPLLSGRGILTIGLDPPQGKEARAVYWSLPLAHLRYYGLPVTKFCSTRTSERDRITVDELLFAWFSAYIKTWDSDPSIPSGEIVRFAGDAALRLHNALKKPYTGSSPYPKSSKGVPNQSQSWLLLLSQIAGRWATSLDQPRVQTLRNLGRNFCEMAGTPFQGIFTISTYLNVAVNLEDKIRLLREIAANLRAQGVANEDYEYLIVYSYDHEGGHQEFEVATACPEFGIENGVVDNLRTPQAYRRWITSPMTGSQLAENKTIKERIIQIRKLDEVAGYHSKPYPIFIRGSTSTTTIEHANTVSINHGPLSRDNRRPREDRPAAVMKLSQDNNYKYDLVFGDLRGVSLLCRRGLKAFAPIIHQGKVQTKKAKPSYTLSMRKLMTIFKPDRIDFSMLAKHLRLDSQTNINVLGMTFIDNLYKGMRDASVDVRAAKVDLSRATWVEAAIESSQGQGPSRMKSYLASSSRIDYLAPRDTDTATSFACIAMMETGSFDFQPSELSSVFALCSSDSLYIASALLRDPAQQDNQQAGITRVTGNIGRAGMALMISPPNPTVRKYELDDWYQYQYQEFDGVLDDSFGGTSLQLSFTEWKQALNVGTTGGRDIEAYFLETLISVYDRDKWIADLDILSTFRSERLLTTFLPHKICTCSAATRAHGNKSSTKLPISMRLVSVGSFAEIIVAPSDPGIITATGNWQARLAAAAICIAKGYRVILRPNDCCWPCLSTVSIEENSVSSMIKGSKNCVMIL